MKTKWFIILGVLIAGAALMAGCGGDKGKPADNQVNPAKLAEVQHVRGTVSEASEGDFVYRLVVGKEQYETGDNIELYAELEYIGKEDSVVIYHAGSPFYFPIYEKTRQYDITYSMITPLLSTTLNKGEPLRERYTGSGGYSEDQDSKAYIAFMKEIMGSSFPVGQYVVSGFADFYVSDEKLGSEQQDYNIKAQVAFEVLK